jgi:hypothetical protein
MAFETFEEAMDMRNNKSRLRDPEDRVIDEHSEKQRKEKMMDKTLADSFPASDPPSPCLIRRRIPSVTRHTDNLVNAWTARFGQSATMLRVPAECRLTGY